LRLTALCAAEQALKAVFNVAHCMGDMLGTSWNLVLNVLEHLDRIIANSKTTTAGGQTTIERAIATVHGATPEATSNELAILSAALNNLFSASTKLSDVAISHFLTALSTQSFASLAHEATSKEKLATPGSAAAQPTRLFALNKFVETTLINLERIAVLWPIATQFLLPVANHQTQRIRVLGVESLSKVVIAAMRLYLSDSQAIETGSGAEAALGTARWPPHKEGSARGPVGTFPSSWDRVLLAPLEELQRRCAYRETHERILSSTHQVLQACGVGLRDGWLMLLSILHWAATKQKNLVSLAFRSVELIASDFLTFLPLACLPAYVEVAAAYATQTDHLNVALTAIGLQWTICDHLFKVQSFDASDASSDADAASDARDGASDGLGPAAPGTAPGTAPDGSAAEEEGVASTPRYAHLNVRDDVRTPDVWRASVTSVRRLCVDVRPEVRTCAMHSFVSIISSHGKNLPGPFLDHLLTRTLHPMLEEIVTKTASASTISSASAASAKLGTEGGRDVMMMVHHSRDTEAKQWDETWVLALDAAVRLYRGFLPQLLSCASFERAWSTLLGFVKKSLLSMPRSSEVALASITAVHSLMLSSVQLSTQGGSSPRTSSDDPAATAPASPKSPPSLQRANTVPAKALVPVASPADGPGSAVQLASGLMSIAASTAPVERERLPPKLWASVWSMLETAIEQATSDASTFATHEKMLCALANRTADLYEGGRGYFEEADVLRLLQLAERLVRSPERPLGWEPTEPTCAPSALQNAVLNLLSKLPPFLIAC